MAEIKSLGIWFSSIKISMIIYEFSGQGTIIFLQAFLLPPSPALFWMLSSILVQSRGTSRQWPHLSCPHIPWALELLLFLHHSFYEPGKCPFPIVVCTIPTFCLFSTFSGSALVMESQHFLAQENKRPYLILYCTQKFHIGPISNKGLQC